MISVPPLALIFAAAVLVLSGLISFWIVGRGRGWINLVLITLVTGWLWWLLVRARNEPDDLLGLLMGLNAVLTFAPAVLGLIVGHLWGRLRALR